MKREEGHRILVVEDDPETAAYLAQVVESRGDRARIATNVAEAKQALVEFDPCLILADQELPAVLGAPPMVASGKHFVEWARAWNEERVDKKWHSLGIIVVTGMASDHEFVSEMYDLGASAFQPKPLGKEGTARLHALMRTCLERAGRKTHADCAHAPRPAGSKSLAPTEGPRIVLDGSRDGTRNVVLVDGERREMTDSPFTSLVLAIGVHVRSPKTWSSREALRMPPSRSSTNRVREPFKGLVPPGFEVLESDGKRSYRLNPAIVVERVAWDALSEHPSAPVKKLAKEMLARAQRA